MNFKIPHSILYLAIGLNIGLFIFGVFLESSNLFILALINMLLCSLPLMIEKEDEE